jgi:hypothetical protein
MSAEGGDGGIVARGEVLRLDRLDRNRGPPAENKRSAEGSPIARRLNGVVGPARGASLDMEGVHGRHVEGIIRNGGPVAVAEDLGIEHGSRASTVGLGKPEEGVGVVKSGDQSFKESATKGVRCETAKSAGRGEDCTNFVA